MPDIPGSSATTTSLAIGGSLTDTLEVNGDRDWIVVNLIAGQKYTITLTGGTLVDPYLRLRDGSGTLVAENDDLNTGQVLDSRIVFTATTTGTYYIDVGAWNDAGSGTYTVAIVPYSPPPVATFAQIAQHLADGYWGNDDHRFNVAPGGTITVNITQLTPAGQALAREALAMWSDVIGITFTEVTTGGQITFDDNQSGAFAEHVSSGGFTISASVNISTQWLTDYGTSNSSYSFQTYLHEIGHALGLGHGGFYNSTANFADDALFLNDSWASTVMSYFDQNESTYYADLGFSATNARSPMPADIRAMQTLYGLSTTTRTGDTTYGFNNNSGRAVYTAQVGVLPEAYTIVDSGGTDTLDYSLFSFDQRINLTQETYSNIGGQIGNVTIGFGTVIENAIGGSGSDIILGNAANNVLTGNSGNDVLNGFEGNDTLISGVGSDLLTGGTGNDIFRDTATNLSGDTIVDFAAGDTIIITNASIAGFTFSLTGTTLSYTGGSLTLSAPVVGTLAASAAAGGGVQIVINTVPAVNDVANDFNGDGRSDILWRNDDGRVINWLGTSSGGFVDNAVNLNTVVPTSWSVAGTGDYNGDGRDDLLWRNGEGRTIVWLGTASGGFTDNVANTNIVVPTAWSVAGIGDFNGDGRDDILWRNGEGRLIDWLGTASGGFIDNAANTNIVVPTVWSVAGIGDFNGDGREDILWRSNDGLVTEWLGTASGGFTDNSANAFYSVPTSWDVASIGDFNGDGRDDILWRNDGGQMTNWLGTPSGAFVDNGANAFNSVPVAWQVQSGDGLDPSKAQTALMEELGLGGANDDALIDAWAGPAEAGTGASAALETMTLFGVANAPEWSAPLVYGGHQGVDPLAAIGVHQDWLGA